MAIQEGWKFPMRTSILLLLLFFIYILPPPLLAARLELRPAAGESTEIFALVGEEIEVALWIDSENQSLSGAAVFLSFDESVFELVTTGRPFVPGLFLGNGEIFRNDLLPDDDPAATSSGTQLDFSVVRAADQGAGSAATFRLRALAPSRESLVRIDESGIRETRIFLPDGSQTAFRFINPLSITVQGISLSGLPERLVLPRGAVDATTFRLDDLIFDPLYAPEEIIWTVSPTASLEISRLSESNVLQVTAPTADSAWEQLILTATNPDGQSSSDTVDIFVAAPPVLDADLAPLAFAEDSPYELSLDDLVEDPDTPAAQLTWAGAGSHHLTVSIEGPPFQARLIPDADWSGTEFATFVVTDDFGFADTTQVAVTVQPINDPPRLMAAPNVRLTSGRQDSSLVIAELAADVEDLSLALSWTGADQISIEQRDGRLVLSGADGWIGTEQIQLQVEDSGGLTDTAPLTVTVAPSVPPSLVGAPQRRGMAAGDHFVLNLDDLVVDPDDTDPTLFWKIDGQQQLRVLLSGSRVARIEAPTDFAGVETLTFTVADPTGESTSFDLLVFAAPLSGEPLIATLPEVSLPIDGVDASLDLDDYIFDLDHEPAQMEFFLPERDDLELRVDPITRMLTITPGPTARTGDLELELRIIDPDGHEAVQTLRLHLTGGLQPPVATFSFASIAPFGFDQDDSFTFDLDDYITGDLPADQISWTTTPPEHLAVSIDSLTHLATLSTTADWTGEEPLTFLASAEGLPIQSQTVPITVRVPVVVLPPELATLPQIGLQAGAVDQSLDLDDYVANVDPATLSWQVDGQRNLRVEVDPETHRVLVVTESDWSGQEILILTGHDDLGNRLDGVLKIDVSPPPPRLELTPVTEIPIFAGEDEIRLDPSQLVGDDFDPAQLTWEAEGTHPLTVVYDPMDRRLVIKPETPWESSEIITLRVRDTAANEATGHLMAQVVPVDGSVGQTTDDFQLAVLPNPMNSSYISLYIVSSPDLEKTPHLRLQEDAWIDLPVELLTPGIWQSSHALSADRQGIIELLALTIDPDRQVLKSSYTMEIAAPRLPAAKPATGPASPTYAPDANPILSAVEADIEQTAPSTHKHPTR
jgi:hypothetical protein